MSNISTLLDRALAAAAGAKIYIDRFTGSFDLSGVEEAERQIQDCLDLLADIEADAEHAGDEELRLSASAAIELTRDAVAPYQSRLARARALVTYQKPTVVYSPPRGSKMVGPWRTGEDRWRYGR